MPYLLFKLFAGAQGFLYVERAFSPFCHVCARALSPKVEILEAVQAKINIFCVQFHGLSKAVSALQLIVEAQGFFPAK